MIEGFQQRQDKPLDIVQHAVAEGTPDDLQPVYERVRARIGEAGWLRMSAHEQTVAIYQEFRDLDTASVERSRHPASQKSEHVAFATNRRIVVRLRLTGQMEAWTVSNENVLPTGRKTRALLAAIALAAPRPALRGRLAELLWSRRPDDQARASLRQEIQLLLRALAPAKAEILHVTRDHLSLTPNATWVDVEEMFRPAINKPAALSVLDGELLEDLDGINPTFDMWLTTERERLRDRARGMAETLLREQTEPLIVIPAAHRLLQIDRAHEEAWRALMRAHAEQGERGMAIQAFDRCRAVLADLLDATPSLETQNLLNEIRGPSSRRLPPRPPHVTVEPAIVPDRKTDSRRREETHAPEITRVGVLPLRSVGMPEDAGHLGSSLANEITTALSRFRRLSVISSNSLTGQARDTRYGDDIRRSHGIDFLVDGAIQRSRNKLRVTLRLLDLREDNQVIWARRFDRSADDLLTVQEDISGEVAAQIDPVMLLAEAKRDAAQSVPGTTAHHFVLRAIPLIMRLDRDGFMRAGEYLAHAVATEPDNGPAQTWYAAWYVLLIGQYWAADPCEAKAHAGILTNRAIVLDPCSAGAFAVAGHVRSFLQQSPQEGAALLQRALELNPNLAVAWAASALTQMLMGDLAEAERRHSRYKALSPLDPYSFLVDGQFVLVHVLKGDHDQAATVGRAVTQLNPFYSAGYKPYLAALGHLGRGQEAEVALRRLQTVEPHVTIERCLDSFPLQREADREIFATGLRRAGLE